MEEIQSLLANFLERVLHQMFSLDKTRAYPFGQLAGRAIHIELRDLELHFILFPDQEGMIVLDHYEGEIDTHIVGTPLTLLRLLFDSTTTLTEHPEITIRGNFTVAQQLLRALQGLNIDWEEHLAQWVGDIPAHHLGTTVQRSQQYAYDIAHSLQLNFSEFLQEESRTLPAPAEMEHFLNSVDILRDDLERLEQRVRRLQKHLPS
jgi:ubiquinone biosynthesis protein UbiJ